MYTHKEMFLSAFFFVVNVILTGCKTILLIDCTVTVNQNLSIFVHLERSSLQELILHFDTRIQNPSIAMENFFFDRNYHFILFCGNLTLIVKKNKIYFFLKEKVISVRMKKEFIGVLMKN